MTDQEDDFELVRGSGNVFADLGLPDAELEQFRAIRVMGHANFAPSLPPK